MVEQFRVKGIVIGERGRTVAYEVVLTNTAAGHRARGWVNAFAGGHVDILDGGNAHLSGTADANASAQLYAKAWASETTSQGVRAS
jgi:hypothetical protein